MSQRIAIISGYRSPMTKAGGALKNLHAADLGAAVLRETLVRTKIDASLIDEVIIGNVGSPADAANIARVIALKAGLDKKIPAYSVHRNCASGMESITTAMNKILAKKAEIIVCGGVESMSNIPLFYNKKATDFFTNLAKSKTIFAKLAAIASIRPSFFKPVIGIVQGLTDPVCNMLMGNTAEVLAKEFKISRQQQDQFALASHFKTQRAVENNVCAKQIVAIFDGVDKLIDADDGVRFNQTLEALAKLRPYFERITGTVTVGNSSQITDGAAMTIVASEEKANQLKAANPDLEILGYLRDYAYAGLDPERMGLGPVYATSKLLDQTKLTIDDFDLIEINEAFAAQVLACQSAFDSKDFAKKYLGKDQAIGKINDKILNINGGAIALGHPVGATGTRIVIDLLHQLKQVGKKRGLATLCVGGGQGAALLLESN